MKTVLLKNCRAAFALDLVFEGKDGMLLVELPQDDGRVGYLILGEACEAFDKLSPEARTIAEEAMNRGAQLMIDKLTERSAPSAKPQTDQPEKE